MSKISIIIQREYLTRVRKRSFIIMTIIGPILMAAMIIAPIYIAQISDEKKVVAVIDDSGLFNQKFQETDYLKFKYLETDLITEKAAFKNNDYYALLYIPRTVVNDPNNVLMYSDSQISLSIQMYIQNAMRSEIELQKIGGFLVDELSRMNLITAQELTDSLRTQLVEMASKIKYSLQANVAIKTIDLSNGSEKKTSAVVSTTIGLFLGIMIYMFIFMYGTQIMRGVIEEKNNRIVEVIISSVRPFQLMIGKITGIALVGLTQFLLWIVLTFSIVMVAQAVLPDKMNITKSEQFSAPQQMQLKQSGQSMSPQDTEKADNSQMINEVLQTLRQIDFVFLLLMFIFYFIGGYLLYGAMFAAIGAAVDNETDTQQFMLPITIPLVFAIIMSQFILNNPGGPVAKWLSIIPFTSPVIMMIRLPFYSIPPYWDVLYSALALIAGFIFTTWFAGKIYRTGILMYGKKPTYKELWRWMRYKA